MREMLLGLLQQRPFQPFRVHLACGAVHEVRRPELARASPFTLRLGRLDPLDTPPAVVNEFFIALDHVVRLEPLAADEPVVVAAGPPAE